ncbi:MAG: hypothetical protein Q9170_007639 [Blastenia crenularia]
MLPTIHSIEACADTQNLMPSALPPSKKRSLGDAQSETDFVSQPNAKRQKSNQAHRTPSSFWDNLSRQWLTRRALQEFDRRTVWPAASIPPHRTAKEYINLAKLQRFARHGGPGLDDIRGYWEPQASIEFRTAMASSQLNSKKRAETDGDSKTPSKRRRTSAYDPAFEQHLIDHGIYPDGYCDHSDDDDSSEVPRNWEEINARLAQPRRSLSPSRFTRKELLEFRKINKEALSESTVMSKVFPIIAGTPRIPSQENLIFGNLKDLTDGSIVQAQPDLYDGIRPSVLARQTREQLSEYIEPSSNTTAPLLPNFFAEAKGPKGSLDVCERQATYDGAIGARGIHAIRSYINPTTAFDDNAYTIVSTYHPKGALTMFTTHPVKPTNRMHETEYRMTQLGSYAMTGSPDVFRQGATAVRNSRELMREYREQFIKAANAKVLNADDGENGSSTQSLRSQSSNELARPDSETSADEGDNAHNANSVLGAMRPPPTKPSHRRAEKVP